MLRSAVMLALPVIILGAQERPNLERPRRFGGGGFHHEGVPPRRERLMEQLHRVRMNRLQQSLGVSEDKAKSIADRWAQFDVESMGRRHQMKQFRQQFNEVLVAPGSEESKNAKLRPLIDQFSSLRQQQQDARHKFEEEIRSSLTPAQQSRFIILMEEFQRELQEAIQEQRKGN